MDVLSDNLSIFSNSMDGTVTATPTRSLDQLAYTCVYDLRIFRNRFLFLYLHVAANQICSLFFLICQPQVTLGTRAKQNKLFDHEL